MRRLAAALAVLSALVATTGASADPLRYGVADDWPKWHACGDAWWQAATGIGYEDVRLTVQWDAALPTVIPYDAELHAAVDCAALAGVRPILAIYPLRPDSIGPDPGAQAEFAAFVATYQTTLELTKTALTQSVPPDAEQRTLNFLRSQISSAKVE